MANPNSPNSLIDTDRGQTLYENPRAAVQAAMRQQGVSQFSPMGAGIMRRFGSSADDLFNLLALSQGGQYGMQAGASPASMANSMNFGDFVKRLISGYMSGANVSGVLGFDPTVAMKTAFANDVNQTAGNTPLGTAYLATLDPSQQRDWMARMVGLADSIGGGNPLALRARAGLRDQAMNEADANFGYGGQNYNWLDLILKGL